MAYLPLMGAFFEASLAVLVKKIINKHKVNFMNFIIYIFLTIVLVSIPLLFFFWDIKPEALQPINIIILILIVIISIFANFFIFYSLKKEDLIALQPIRLSTPLFTILLVFIFSFFFEIYQAERNYSILALSIIASLALIFSHLKDDKIMFNKYAIAALIGSFLFALELTLSKAILFFYNPITFYFIRSLWVFILVWIFLHKKLSPIHSKTKILILIAGIIAVMYRVILYYGFLTLGVIFTTTIFILAPVLTYIFAHIFLKEKITLRQIISSIIIITCVVLAVVIGN